MTFQGSPVKNEGQPGSHRSGLLKTKSNLVGVLVALDRRKGCVAATRGTKRYNTGKQQANGFNPRNKLLHFSKKKETIYVK